MAKHTIIWDHEKAQTREIARGLVAQKPDISGWRIIKLPIVGGKLIHWRHKIRLAQKNLLFTKELAFAAAKAVDQGADRALELGRADWKTREVLKQDKQGYYSEKIRKKQLAEMELLFDHYLRLMTAQGRAYQDLVKGAYNEKRQYTDFLKRLEEREAAVIQAALSTMKKASKKERIDWFNRVSALTRQVREIEVKDIYGE